MTLTTRPATIEDTEFVWACRQELTNPVMRQSQRSEVFAEHAAWMARAVVDPDRLFLIAQDGVSPIGYVRFDPQDTPPGWRVSLCIAADFRGGGRGQMALAAGCGAADGQKKSPQIADIHSENPASARVFEACGFLPLDAKPGPDGFRRYIRSPKRTEP